MFMFWVSSKAAYSPYSGSNVSFTSHFFSHIIGSRIDFFIRFLSLNTFFTREKRTNVLQGISNFICFVYQMLFFYAVCFWMYHSLLLSRVHLYLSTFLLFLAAGLLFSMIGLDTCSITIFWLDLSDFRVHFCIRIKMCGKSYILHVFYCINSDFFFSSGIVI